MITSELIQNNIVIPGKTAKVLQLVQEIQEAQASLQEKLFQLDGMITERSGLRKLPETVTKLLPGPKASRKGKKQKDSQEDKKRTRRTFSDEFRAMAVGKVLDQGRKVGDVVDEYKLSRSMFNLWLAAARAGKPYGKKSKKLLSKKNSVGRPKKSEGQLPPKVLSAYNAIKETLMATRDKVALTYLMKLRGQSPAGVSRALTHMKGTGEVIVTRESIGGGRRGAHAFCTWNRGKTSKAAASYRPRVTHSITVESNPLYNDPVAIALRAEMKKTKRTGSGVFPKEFSEKLRAFALEKWAAVGASTGQIAHALGVAGPSVQRWLKLGIYAKKDSKKDPSESNGKPNGANGVHAN